jgi:hypothetical protein
MAKFTKSIRFGLTPWLFSRIRAQAKRQKVSGERTSPHHDGETPRRIGLAESRGKAT